MIRWLAWPLLMSCGAPQDCPDVVLGWAGGSLTADAGECGSVTLSPTVHADGDVRVDVDVADEVATPTLIAAGDAVVHALVWEGSFSLPGSGPLRWWRQGYRSDSWSGVVELADGDGIRRSGPYDLPAVGGDGSDADTPWTSWWGGVVGRPDEGAWAVGAVRAQRLPVWLAAWDDHLVVAHGGRGEALSMAAGEQVALGGLHVARGTAAEAAASWGEAVASASEGPRPDRVPPVGWTTGHVRETSSLGGLIQQDRPVLSALGEVGDLLLLDEGWQAAIGDWTAVEALGQDTATLAASIVDDGLTPGLWLAPLLANPAAPVVAEHGDWWVLDGDGEPWLVDGLRVLDVTDEEAEAWLVGELQRLTGEGWAFLVLDALDAGAVPGVRDEDLTGLQAYTRALTLFRDAVGPDVWLRGARAPFLPSVGALDSVRIAPSDAPADDPPDQAVRLRQIAARAFAHGRWWWHDAGPVRFASAETPPAVEGLVVSTVLSGGAFVLADDLAVLDDGRLRAALDEAQRAFLGVRAELDHPLDAVAPFSGGTGVPSTFQTTAWTLSSQHRAWLHLGADDHSEELPPGDDGLGGARWDGGERVLRPGEGVLLFPDRTPGPLWPDVDPFTEPG